MMCAPFDSFVFILFTLLGSSTSLRVLEVTGDIRPSGALETATVDDAETPDETFNSFVDDTFQVTEPAHDAGAAAQLGPIDRLIYDAPWTVKSVDETFLAAELAAWTQRALTADASAKWSSKVFGGEMILEHPLWVLELATGILVLLIVRSFSHRHALRSAEEEVFIRVVHVM